jgi:soluble lytic murein transglycosylase-like protein
LVDHSITHDKDGFLEKKIAQSRGKDKNAIETLNNLTCKTVFWKGRIKCFNRHNGYIWFLIQTEENRNVWVYALDNAGQAGSAKNKGIKKGFIRNLDFDRTGFLIGVKGNLVFEHNSLSFLKARSVILIAPPNELSYANFIKHYSVPEQFTLNTNKGNMTITHIHYPFILHRIYIHNPHYSWQDIQKIGKGIIYFSYKYSIDPLLVTALINVESAFDVDAVSSSGAIGLGQLMPSTASGLGTDPRDTFQNIGGCVKYFSNIFNRWNGRKDQISLTLASYNAGPGAVARYKGIPPFSETQNYVFFINHLYNEYKKQYNISIDEIIKENKTSSGEERWVEK